MMDSLANSAKHSDLSVPVLAWELVWGKVLELELVWAQEPVVAPVLALV